MKKTGICIHTVNDGNKYYTFQKYRCDRVLFL
jgi:hypothetical protein